MRESLMGVDEILKLREEQFKKGYFSRPRSWKDYVEETYRMVPLSDEPDEED